MKLTSATKILGIATSAVGFIQSTAWFGLSLAAIVFYHYQLDTTNLPSTYTAYIGQIIYSKFFTDTTVDRYIITPVDFQTFMWFYIFLSAILGAVSVDQYFAVRGEKKRLGVVMMMWGIVALTISIVDIVFVSLLARDYSVCNDMTCYLSVGIVMTIAARGYTLWLINTIFAVLTIVAAGAVLFEEFRDGDPLYSTHSIPRAHVTSTQRNNTNKNYETSGYGGTTLYNTPSTNNDNLYY